MVEPWVKFTSIGAIIATLVSPSLAQFFAWRLNHPKPKPETTQPQTRLQSIRGWLLRTCLSPFVIPPSGIAVYICLLLYELHLATPVTRRVIFIISLSIVQIFYDLAIMVSLALAQDIRHLQHLRDKYILLHEDFIALFKGLLDVDKTTSESNREIDQGFLTLAALLEGRLKELEKQRTPDTHV